MQNMNLNLVKIRPHEFFPLQIVRGFCNGRSVLLDIVT